MPDESLHWPTSPASSPGTLRVALVGPFPMHPLRFGGGVETSTWHLAQGLRDLGVVAVHVVTTAGVLRERLVFDSEGMRFHYLPSPTRFNTLTRYRLMGRRVRAELRTIGPDVVHAQDAIVHGSICLELPWPVVISVHGVVDEEARHIAERIDRVRRRVQGRIQRRTVSRAQHLIQPTTYPQQRLGTPTDPRWHDTGNAIADRFFTIEREPSPGTVLYVGSIIRRKRLVDLVDAVAHLRRTGHDIRLRVVGPVVEPGYAEEVHAAVDRHELRPHVAFLGLLGQDELSAEYARCTFLVLPSGQETSPMVIAEAMAAGVPVIATEVGGVGSLISDTVSGFVVPVDSVHVLADRMGRLLMDSDLAASFAVAARRQAETRFRSSRVAARVLDVYRSAMRDHGVASGP